MSLKQLIISAIIKVSEENPLLNHPDAKTANESRDQFIQLLMNELFPEAEVETTHITVPVVPVEAPTPTKKRGPMTEEAKAAMKAKKAANAAAKAETPVPVVPVPVEAPTPTKKRGPMTEEAKAAMKAKKAANAAAKQAVEAPAPEPVVVEAPAAPTPTKKRGPMTEEAKAAMKAKKAANAAAKAAPVPEPAAPVEAPAKEKKPRAKKAVPENTNLPKIDPTWRKHLKAADKEHAKELEPELLKYLNSLSNEDFHAKTTETHVADFIASRSDGKVETDMEIVEFNGKDYYVNPETNRVYEGEGVYDEATQEWTNYLAVGYVGMSTFTHMKL